MNTEHSQGAGTARLLHEIAEYEEMEREFGEPLATLVTTRAAQKVDPSITAADTRGALKFIRAARTGNVNIAASRQEVEDLGDRAANRLIAETSKLRAKLES